MVNFPHQTVIPWLINSQVTSKQSFLHYFDVKTESLKIGMQKGWAIFNACRMVSKFSPHKANSRESLAHIEFL